MRRLAIAGGSGYVGGELLRLLASHPGFEVAQVTSERHAGQPVRLLHPHLRGRSDLRFCPLDALEPADVLVSCLPHGRAAALVERFADLAPRVVDCSADFRLDDADAYREVYGAEHPAPEWLPRFVYGLPEARRDRLRDATHVSGVGCNATASNLALLPLVRAGLLDPARPVVVDLKVGSSEAGRAASATSHHPERSGVVRAFAPVDHRHTAEVRAVTGLADVHLSVTSVELVRGVAAAAHVWLARPTTERELWGAYREAYADEPFVRVVHETRGAYRHPEPRLVTATNEAHVGWALAEDGRRLVALCALDNLTKGAAGSALQSLNLMCGLPETAGLEQAPVHPL